MELIQTKKWINMAEVDLIAEFSARAANGEPDLNWNKVMEKINRDRSVAGVPTLRQRCFVAIMKSGGADDGRIRGWSKRKYLKSIGYKQQDEDFQKKLQEGIKKLLPKPESEVPLIEKSEEEKETESSVEAEEASKLSSDALALLKFYINKGISLAAAKKFFGVCIRRIATANKELVDMQILGRTGSEGKRGSYTMLLEKGVLFQLYPQVQGVCLQDDMKKKSSKKAEEKKEVEKDSFDPQDKLQDAVALIRRYTDEGINYGDCNLFKEILPSGNKNQWMEIQKMLEDLDILIRTGEGGVWFFQDPEDGISIHDDPIMNKKKVVEPEIIKGDVVPVENVSKNGSLTEDSADSITVNCFRKDVKYRVMKSANGYVIDIM